MKNIIYTLLCIALIGCASPQQQEQNDTTMNKDNNELTAFDVQKEFQKNGFDWWYIQCVVDGQVACGFIDTGTSSFTLGGTGY